MKLKSIMKPAAPTVEAGSYLAVCIGVVAVGEQYVPAYGDRNARYESQLVFVWEIPSEADENGIPKQLSKKVNATPSVKGNLMAILSSWNSRSYTKEELTHVELYDQLGKPCMLAVSVNENGFANVTAVSAVPKGVPVPVSRTPHIKFSVNEWSDEGFAALPDWLQNRIKESSEYKERMLPASANSVDVNVTPPAPQPVIDITNAVLGPAPAQEVVPF